MVGKGEWQRIMHNGYIIYLLRMLVREHAIASLYAEPQDPEGFTYVYVEQVTPRHVLLAAITPWGKLDGWWIRRTADIFQVLCGEEYEQRLAFLMAYHDQVHCPLLPAPPAEDADLMRVVLAYAIDRGQIVTLMTAEESFAAQPIQVDDLRLTLRALDLFGKAGEEEVLPLRDIEALSLGTEEEKMYDILVREAPAFPEGGPQSS